MSGRDRWFVRWCYYCDGFVMKMDDCINVEGNWNFKDGTGVDGLMMVEE